MSHDLFEQRLDSVEQRLAHVEQLVRELQPTIHDVAKPPPPAPAPAQLQPKVMVIPEMVQLRPPTPAPIQTPLPPPPVLVQTNAAPASLQTNAAPVSVARSTEFWLNKIGIGLLIIGILFFFKYSIDRGWLMPWLRVTLGGLTGGGLIITAMRLAAVRRGLAQTLIGGGLAVWYTSIFAAAQLYSLLPLSVAIVAMSVVTLIGFGLGVTYDSLALAFVAFIGGLLTPFLLSDGSAHIAGFVIYTGLLISGTTAIYVFKYWRSLLYAAAFGGGLLLSLAWFNAHLADRWILQAGATWLWLVFWLMPIAAYMRRGVVPLPKSDLLSMDATFAIIETRINRHVHQFSLVSAVAVLSYTHMIWGLNQSLIGWIMLSAALIYASIGWWLNVHKQADLSYTQMIVALLLGSVAVACLFRGDVLVIALTCEVVALHLLARRLNDGFLRLYAHFIALVGVWVWLIARPLPLTLVHPFWNVRVFSDLILIGAGLGIAGRLAQKYEQQIYVFVAEMLLMIVMLRESMLVWQQSHVLLAMYMLGLSAAWFFSRNPVHRVSTAVVALGLLLYGIRRITFDAVTPIMINLPALADVMVIGLWAIVARFAEPTEKPWYRAGAFVLLFGWLFRELAVLGLHVQLLSWAVLAVTIYGLARRQNDTVLPWLSHLAFALITIFYVLSSINSPHDAMPLLNLRALSELTIFVIVAWLTWQHAQPERAVYGSVGYTLLLYWCVREFNSVANGNAFATMGWAMLAILLLAIGWFNDATLLLRMGLLTIGLMLLKLFMVDLQSVDVIWRIGLFLGLGVAFLLLSYLFPNLWRQRLRSSNHTNDDAAQALPD